MSQLRSTSPRTSLRFIALFTALIVGIGAAFTAMAWFTKSQSPAPEPETLQLVSESGSTIPTLSFLYIDKTTVSPDEEQAIAVSFDDDTTPLAATIQLTQPTTGQTQRFDAAKTNEHAALFTFPASTLSEGDWTVVGVEGDDDAGTFTVAVDESAGEGSTSFTVVAPEPESEPAPAPTPEGTETPATPEPSTTDEPPLMTTYYVNEGDKLVGVDTFDEALLAAATVAGNQPSTAAQGKLKVALDPGHGAEDSGALAVNGAYESVLNWKISQACKNELSQYRNVEIFLTRGENECPSIKERVDRAVAWGADVIISQHNNSADVSSARGAQVYIPGDSSFNYNTHTEGAKLGAAIEAELVKLGLWDRGGNLTRAGAGSWYPDGSIEDYYGIIRYARYAGKTGIIVEHAFVSSWQDYNDFLSDDAKLTALGVADATGIAKCYGLSKGPQLNWQPTVAAHITSDSMAASIAVSGGAPATVNAVRAVVTRGDAVHTYQAQLQSDGRWIATAPLAELRDPGTYNVEIIANFEGEEISVGATTFAVAATASATMTVESVNTTNGTISVVVDAHSPVGISEVHLPVWCETVNGQDDLDWYTMNPDRVDANGNGTYRLTIKATSHKLQSGSYHLDLYITEKNGVFSGLRSQVVDLDLPPFRYTVERDDGGKSVTVSAWGGLLTASTPVLFPTWSTANGQDDIHWYEGAYDSRTRVWKKTILFKDHGENGLYTVHCYAQLDGDLVYLDASAFSVSHARGTAEVTAVDDARGTATVKANVAGERGVAKVELAAWCDSVGGADDLHRVTMTPSSVDSDGNGIYSTTVSVANHANQTGKYTFELYVTDSIGITTKVDTQTATIGNETVSFTVVPVTDSESDITGYRLSAASTQLTALTPVTFKVGAAGSSEEATYPGVYESAALRWVATVPIEDFEDAGDYWARCYADFGKGAEKVADAAFRVPEEAIPQPERDYPIMGEPATDIDQMVRFYTNSGETYPATVLATKGAPTIRSFCTIAYEEAVAEGVRPEVLMAQVTLETGWLQFNHDVKNDQCNFGGIGATGDGEEGATFPDVRTGLRAQVQHLKAYASTGPLTKEKVDPRFDLVKRGSAPTVQKLAGKWAADKQYGDKLIRLLDSLAAA